MSPTITVASFWGFERAKRSDEVSIVPRLLAFWFFFSRDIPSAFVLIEGYFLRAYFSATIQTFQKKRNLMLFLTV